MKRNSVSGCLILFGCILVTLASGQYVEATLQLPDPLAGLREPQNIIYNPANNTVVVSGYGTGIAVIDGATQRRAARIPVPANTRALCYDEHDNKVYCGAADSGLVFVVDGNSNRLLATIDVGAVPTRLCYNPTANKVYCALNRSGGKAPEPSGRGQYRQRLTPPASGPRRRPASQRAGLHALREPVRYRVLPEPDLFDYNNPTDSWNSIAVIDCSTDSLIAAIQLTDAPEELCYNPAGNKLYCGLEGSGELLVIDGAADTLLGSVRLNVLDYGRIRYNPASDRLYCADYGFNELAVLDAGADSLIRWLRVGRGPADVCLNPVLNKVYVADYSSGEVDVISGSGDTSLTYLDLNAGPYALVYDSVNNRVFCSAYYTNRLVPIDCAADSLLPGIPVGGEPGPLAYNPQANVVYAVCTDDHKVAAVDAEAGRVLTQISFWFTPAALSYSTTSDKLYCAGEDEAQVAVLDGQTHALLATLDVGTEPDQLLYAPGENKVYCAAGNEDNPVLHIIDCGNDSIRATLPDSVSYPAPLAYNPVARKVYCAGENDYTGDAEVIVVDGQGDTVLARLTVGSYPTSTAVNPLDNKVYVNGEYNTVTIIDGAADSLLRTLVVGNAAGLCHVPFDDVVYCANYGPFLARIDGVTNEFIDWIRVGGGVNVLVYAATLNRLYAIDGYSGFVAALDCSSRHVVATAQVGASVAAVSFDSLADRLYFARDSRDSVSILDCRSNQTRRLAVGDNPRAIAWNPARRRMYVANRHDASISVIRDTTFAALADQGFGPQRQRPGPTLLHAVLTLENHTRGRLLDISGRCVARLAAGDNDIRHLPPGIYFVQAGPADAALTYSAVRKLIVTR